MPDGLRTKLDAGKVRKASEADVKALAQALADRGVTAETLAAARIKRLRLDEKSWQAMHKDKDGEAVITDLQGGGFVLDLAPEWDGPEWPVVQQATPVKVQIPATQRLFRTDGRKTALIIPDAQYPYHDDAALDAAMRVAEAIRPDLIVWLGDNLDLSEMGRFLTEPRFAGSTQGALDALHARLAQFAALGAEQKYLAGNHEARLAKFIIQNAAAAFGLRQANVPSAWPVLSVEHLLRLDELGVEYIGGYPAGEVWLNDRLRCIHGHKHRGAKHSTAAAYAQESHVSTIFGHLHRVDMSYRTHRVRGGSEQVMAACPGAMCKLDGSVPGYGSGFDAHGTAVVTADPWQHGFAVVTYEETGAQRFAYEHVAVENGEALFRGALV